MDADDFFRDVDACLHRVLPISRLKIWPSNNFVRITFSEVEGFIAAIIAATGSNIELKISGVLDRKESKPRRDISSCTIFMSLENECLDVKLLYFAYEVLLISQSDGKISDEQFNAEKSALAKYDNFFGDS